MKTATDTVIIDTRNLEPIRGAKYFAEERGCYVSFDSDFNRIAKFRFGGNHSLKMCEIVSGQQIESNPIVIACRATSEHVHTDERGTKFYALGEPIHGAASNAAKSLI